MPCPSVYPWLPQPSLSPFYYFFSFSWTLCRSVDALCRRIGKVSRDSAKSYISEKKPTEVKVVPLDLLVYLHKKHEDLVSKHISTLKAYSVPSVLEYLIKRSPLEEGNDLRDLLQHTFGKSIYVKIGEEYSRVLFSYIWTWINNKKKNYIHFFFLIYLICFVFSLKEHARNHMARSVSFLRFHFLPAWTSTCVILIKHH